MKKDDSKPYEFPQECPQRDQKFDKGVIVDVVENEIKPNKQSSENNSYSVWEYKGNKNNG